MGTETRVSGPHVNSSNRLGLAHSFLYNFALVVRPRRDDGLEREESEHRLRALDRWPFSIVVSELPPRGLTSQIPVEPAIEQPLFLRPTLLQRFGNAPPLVSVDGMRTKLGHLGFEENAFAEKVPGGKQWDVPVVAFKVMRRNWRCDRRRRGLVVRARRCGARWRRSERRSTTPRTNPGIPLSQAQEGKGCLWTPSPLDIQLYSALHDA